MNSQLVGAPGYWRDETSGLLAPVVTRYLQGERALNASEIDILRRYFVQWACASIWDTNPHLDHEGEANLERLRERARAIRAISDVDRWREAALELGMDPL